MPQPPNMNKMLQQVQKMQQDMMAAQESLKDERVEASAGGGMVKVVATGELAIESITIDPDAARFARPHAVTFARALRGRRRGHRARRVG